MFRTRNSKIFKALSVLVICAFLWNSVGYSQALLDTNSESFISPAWRTDAMCNVISDGKGGFEILMPDEGVPPYFAEEFLYKVITSAMHERNSMKAIDVVGLIDNYCTSFIKDGALDGVKWSLLTEFDNDFYLPMDYATKGILGVRIFKVESGDTPPAKTIEIEGTVFGVEEVTREFLKELVKKKDPPENLLKVFGIGNSLNPAFQIGHIEHRTRQDKYADEFNIFTVNGAMEEIFKDEGKYEEYTKEARGGVNAILNDTNVLEDLRELRESGIDVDIDQIRKHANGTMRYFLADNPINDSPTLVLLHHKDYQVAHVGLGRKQATVSRRLIKKWLSMGERGTFLASVLFLRETVIHLKMQEVYDEKLNNYDEAVMIAERYADELVDAIVGKKIFDKYVQNEVDAFIDEYIGKNNLTREQILDWEQGYIIPDTVGKQIFGGKTHELMKIYAEHPDKSLPAFGGTTQACIDFLKEDETLLKEIEDDILMVLNTQDEAKRMEAEEKIKERVKNANIFDELEVKIKEEYWRLCEIMGVEKDQLWIAVRSAGRAEDISVKGVPEMSDIEVGANAGQHDSFLGVRGANEVVKRWKDCIASLYTERVLDYRDGMMVYESFAQLLPDKIKLAEIRKKLAASGDVTEKLIAECLDPQHVDIKPVGSLILENVLRRNGFTKEADIVAESRAKYIRVEGISMGVTFMPMADTDIGSYVNFGSELTSGWTAMSFQEIHPDEYVNKGRVFTLSFNYGLGESIVQGVTTPDTYLVHMYKDALGRDQIKILQKQLGAKPVKTIYIDDGLRELGLSYDVKEEEIKASNDLQREGGVTSQKPLDIKPFVDFFRGFEESDIYENYQKKLEELEQDKGMPEGEKEEKKEELIQKAIFGYIKKVKPKEPKPGERKPGVIPWDLRDMLFNDKSKTDSMMLNLWKMIGEKVDKTSIKNVDPLFLNSFKFFQDKEGRVQEGKLFTFVHILKRLIEDPAERTFFTKVGEKERNMFALTDSQVKLVARDCMAMARNYGHLVDMEGAIGTNRGVKNKSIILQRRPNNAKADISKPHMIEISYTYVDKKDLEEIRKRKEPVTSLINRGDLLCNGIPTRNAFSGVIFTIDEGRSLNKQFEAIKRKVNEGYDVIIRTRETTPEYVPVLKYRSKDHGVCGVIADVGGSTSHAAVVSRELGIATVVGIQDYLDKLENTYGPDKANAIRNYINADGSVVIVDANPNDENGLGSIYAGELPISKMEIKIPINRLPYIYTKIAYIMGMPHPMMAMSKIAQYPGYYGVALQRAEFPYGEENINPRAGVTYDNMLAYIYLKTVDRDTNPQAKTFYNGLASDEKIALDRFVLLYKRNKEKRAEGVKVEMSNIENIIDKYSNIDNAAYRFMEELSEEAHKDVEAMRAHVKTIARLNKGKSGKEAETSEVAKLTEQITGYLSYHEFFKTIHGGAVAGMAAANNVKRNSILYRSIDFKKNESRKLIGSIIFDPESEPSTMVGERGGRWLKRKENQIILRTEIRLLLGLIEEGYTNIGFFFPFVSTPEELKMLLDILDEEERAMSEEYGRPIYMHKVGQMIELPSNVVYAKEFAEILKQRTENMNKYFNAKYRQWFEDHKTEAKIKTFFSFGTNDLTQLTLGADRDMPEMAGLFDESHEYVVESIRYVVNVAKEAGIECGLCGQAIVNLASKNPEAAEEILMMLGSTGGYAGTDYIGTELAIVRAASATLKHGVVSEEAKEGANVILEDIESSLAKGAASRPLYKVESVEDLLGKTYIGDFALVDIEKLKDADVGDVKIRKALERLGAVLYYGKRSPEAQNFIDFLKQLRVPVIRINNQQLSSFKDLRDGEFAKEDLDDVDLTSELEGVLAEKGVIGLSEILDKEEVDEITRRIEEEGIPGDNIEGIIKIIRELRVGKIMDILVGTDYLTEGYQLTSKFNGFTEQFKVDFAEYRNKVILQIAKALEKTQDRITIDFNDKKIYQLDREIYKKDPAGGVDIVVAEKASKIKFPKKNVKVDLISFNTEVSANDFYRDGVEIGGLNNLHPLNFIAYDSKTLRTSMSEEAVQEVEEIIHATRAKTAQGAYRRLLASYIKNRGIAENPDGTKTETKLRYVFKTTDLETDDFIKFRHHMMFLKEAEINPTLGLSGLYGLVREREGLWFKLLKIEMEAVHLLLNEGYDIAIQFNGVKDARHLRKAREAIAAAGFINEPKTFNEARASLVDAGILIEPKNMTEAIDVLRRLGYQGKMPETMDEVWDALAGYNIFKNPRDLKEVEDILKIVSVSNRLEIERLGGTEEEQLENARLALEGIPNLQFLENPRNIKQAKALLKKAGIRLVPDLALGMNTAWPGNYLFTEQFIKSGQLSFINIDGMRLAQGIMAAQLDGKNPNSTEWYTKKELARIISVPTKMIKSAIKSKGIKLVNSAQVGVTEESIINEILDFIKNRFADEVDAAANAAESKEIKSDLFYLKDRPASDLGEADPNALILFADDILEKGLVVDMEQTLKQETIRKKVMSGGHIILYTKVQREEGDKSLEALEKIIKAADSSITVTIVTPDELGLDEGKAYSIKDELERLQHFTVQRISASNGGMTVNNDQILGVFKGPRSSQRITEIPNCAKDLQLPIIVFGEKGDGAYSFAEALKEALRIRRDLDPGVWFKVLEPIKRFDMEKGLKDEYFRLVQQVLIKA